MRKYQQIGGKNYPALYTGQRKSKNNQMIRIGIYHVCKYVLGVKGEFSHQLISYSISIMLDLAVRCLPVFDKFSCNVWEFPNFLNLFSTLPGSVYFIPDEQLCHSIHDRCSLRVVVYRTRLKKKKKGGLRSFPTAFVEGLSIGRTCRQNE